MLGAQAKGVKSKDFTPFFKFNQTQTFERYKSISMLYRLKQLLHQYPGAHSINHHNHWAEGDQSIEPRWG